ncbi:MAG: serine--tRNA ligase [Acidobacteriota bacterium]
MLDRDLLRDDTGRTRTRLLDRGTDAADFDRWQQLDRARRELQVAAETLQHERKVASKAIGVCKRQGIDASEAIAEVAALKQRLADAEAQLEAMTAEVDALETTFPNLVDDDVPVGPDESSNRAERTIGTPPTFDFTPQAHWDLGPALGLLDFERAAKIAGARFSVLTGVGARLERALAHYMLDLHAAHGYLEVSTPYLVNSDALFGTGQLPKFADDLFTVDGHDLYLIPTAEVPVTNLHRDEILDADQLPLRYVSYTPCFRAEAGSYGKDVRGMIRQHQFSKVELVQLVHPDDSADAHVALTGHAEAVLQGLGLAYRAVTLCSGDTGFAAARTTDLEVWLPGQDAYREISSCSNFRDFQARRAGIRFRPAGGGRPQYAHTLNGSGLAIGRTLVAILENYQEADGGVRIPDALLPYMRGLARIDPPAAD